MLISVQQTFILDHFWQYVTSSNLHWLLILITVSELWLMRSFDFRCRDWNKHPYNAWLIYPISKLIEYSKLICNHLNGKLIICINIYIQKFILQYFCLLANLRSHHQWWENMMVIFQYILTYFRVNDWMETRIHCLSVTVAWVTELKSQWPLVFILAFLAYCHRKNWIWHRCLCHPKVNTGPSLTAPENGLVPPLHESFGFK